MSIEHRVGSLFDQRDAQALGHGVNCAGVMGAGIARQFRSRWPDMYDYYRTVCAQTKVRPGEILPWWPSTRRCVYNLATQDRPGPYARLDWVRAAVQAMLDHAVEFEVASVAIPRIGAGIGGLDWTTVNPALTQLAAPSPVTLIVVSRPEDAG